MKKVNIADRVLVFDRYYGNKPITGILIAERILFCVTLSVFSMLFIISEYGFDISLLNVGIFTGLCTALFSGLFIFVSRSIAIPTILLIVGAIIYFNLEDIWLRFSYFVDEAMLLVEGRFLFPRGYLLHDEVYLTSSNRLYSEGMIMGTFLLCALFSLLCAASMKKRIRCIPALLGFILLCVPRILSETFEFKGWLIPVLLLFTVAAAISTIYTNGLAVVKSGSNSYSRQVRDDEGTFLSNIKKASFLKRISMKYSFFSKYLTTGMYCALSFAVALSIALSVFSEGESIDYTPVYDFITGVSEDNSDSPFENGPVSDYFTSTQRKDRNEGLNITSPGNGNKEIIRVTFTGNSPIYLRGDVGVEFTGDGWTTPVTDSELWRRSRLSESYRPCELDVVRTLLSALGSEYTSVVEGTDVSIEYLCETDVVFLPAYTSEYSFYNNEGFDVYGDYSVRVAESAGDYIRSVQCTSLAYDFGDFSDYYSYETLINIKNVFRDNLVNVNDFYGTVVPEMASEENIISDYLRYVEETYTQISGKDRRDMLGFIEENISGINVSEIDVSSEADRYLTAATISDYLTDNYTYTLSGENDSNSPVMEFLTETKRGHCSLYASAMTLMLRSLDIPARYCTGFSVYPNNEYTSIVVMREKNLHAWVEVYLGQMGWVTFDPTSGAINGDQINNNSNNDNSVPEEKESEETSQSVDEETKETPASPNHGSNDNEPDKTEEFTLPIELIITLLIIIIVIVAVILLVYRYISVKKRAEDILRRIDYIDGRVVYSKLIDILYLFKIRPSAGQQPSVYYAEAEKELGCSLSEHSSVLEKAAFGLTELSEDEQREMTAVFTAVYNSAIVSSRFLRRHRIRLIVLSCESKTQG